MASLLETWSLNKSFGAVVAAADITVSVGEGETLGLIGANGAGKTTFINLVTGWLRPSAGRIFLRGRDVTGQSVRRITRAGMCRSFQVAQLFPELTVLDNMLLALHMLAEGRLAILTPMRKRTAVAQAEAVLDRFGIAEHAPALVSTLPQGVRKLLDIALASVGEPQILLLDEPTSGVAVEEKFALMDTVMTVAGYRGGATLFVEHDMEIVERYASRVLAFYEGRVLADGPPAQVLADADVKAYVIGTELHSEVGSESADRVDLSTGAAEEVPA